MVVDSGFRAGEGVTCGGSRRRNDPRLGSSARLRFRANKTHAPNRVEGVSGCRADEGVTSWLSNPRRRNDPRLNGGRGGCSGAGGGGSAGGRYTPPGGRHTRDGWGTRGRRRGAWDSGHRCLVEGLGFRV